jgi:hypothetical protein
MPAILIIETFATDSVTKNEQPNPIRDNENSPNPQPNDYGNPIADNDNAVDEPVSQPSNADDVTNFTPTHELPSGEKVKLETNDDGEKYFVEQDGSEWNYDDNAEAITNEKEDNAPSDMGIGANGSLGNKTSEVASATVAPMDSEVASDNQAMPPVENAVESKTPETPAENIQPTQQDVAPTPTPILKADGTPVTSNIGARQSLKAQGLFYSHEVVKQDDGSFVAVPKAQEETPVVENQAASNSASYDDIADLIKRPSDNAPFSSESNAAKALRNNKNLNDDEHDVVPVTGGFAIAPTASLGYDQFKADSVAIFCERFLWHPCQ